MKTRFISIPQTMIFGLPLLFSSTGAFPASDTPKPVVRVNSRDVAGGRIVSLRTAPLKALLYSNAPHVDQCVITLKMVHPARVGGKLHNLIAGDLKPIDGRGRNIELFTGNAQIGYGPTKHINTGTLTESRFVLTLARAYKTHNPLTLRGRIKVDDRWKVPFSVRLPLR